MKTNTYRELTEAFESFLKGTLTPEALKPVTAPYGIYQQRNGAFMTRVRITGGEIACDRLMDVAGVLDEVGGHAHLTSRQDLQIHDVPAARVPDAVRACERLGLPFRGGGGNTYRNVLVAADSGIAPDSLFDVYPYAQALHRAMLKVDHAFALPRKLKIGFFASERDHLRAAVQDLGFLARIRDGEKGFTVYAAGGMGRASRVGMLLFDFLPASQVLRAAVALTDLFYAHGDRANRSQARLRFLLAKLGPEAFLRLYLEFFARASVPPFRVPDSTSAPSPALAHGAGAPRSDPGFDAWSAIAVQPTRFGDDVVSVRLYVPYGNLRGGELRALASLATDCGSPFVRLLPTQDLLIPCVHRSMLPVVYARLRGALASVDLTFASYKGHLTTCVGACVCKIGMADAPAVGDRIAAELDRYLPADTPEKRALLRVAADDLRLSGCPNACSGHPAARIGVGCILQKADGEIRTFMHVLTGAGVTDGVPRLAVGVEEAAPLPLEDGVRAVVDACLAAARVG